jgi:hypothetical protein
MKHATINSSWVSWSKGYRLDAAFWVAVTARLTDQGLDPATAGEADVRTAIAHVEGHD